jgi:hypothetical protein
MSVCHELVKINENEKELDRIYGRDLVSSRAKMIVHLTLVVT